ncbi:nucleotidyltransferase [Candidatus Woesearchaeota archaeon B3_Woes]|nr:MAG: nucleotidyltransferase [Candidatus Woesearchaeota archaeon B3_Woes]
MNLTAVYMAAGRASRFGGRIKALIQIGPNNETLMGLSMQQAKQAGFNKFVIIASPQTLESLKEVYKDNFLENSVEYCIQETPDYREKPFGTSHALLSAKEFVKEPFIVLNSDDLYGKNTMKYIANYLKITESGYCLPGYKLKNVLSKHGGVNRGIIKIDSENYMEGIKETFDILKKDVGTNYSGEELISMNLFGLQPDFFNYLEEALKKFLKEHPNDPKTEFLLPNSVSNFKNEKDTKIKVVPTDDIWIGVTNPEDEEKMREQLKNS